MGVRRADEGIGHYRVQCKIERVGGQSRRPLQGNRRFFVKKVLYFLGVLWYLKQDGALAPETPLSVLGQRRIFTSAHT